MLENRPRTRSGNPFHGRLIGEMAASFNKTRKLRPRRPRPLPEPQTHPHWAERSVQDLARVLALISSPELCRLAEEGPFSRLPFRIYSGVRSAPPNT